MKAAEHEENSAERQARAGAARSPDSLVEGEDYYAEGATIVFTAGYHQRRGYCCESRCRHCPYGLAPGPETPAAGNS